MKEKEKTAVRLLIERVKERWIPDTLIAKNKTEWNAFVKAITELNTEQIHAAHRAEQESAYYFKEKETAEEYYNKTYSNK